MHHLLEHINQNIKRRLSKDKDSTVNKTEYRSKRNPTGKPRWARQTDKGPTISSVDKSLSRNRHRVWSPTHRRAIKEESWHMRPPNTKISMCIRAVWSKSSLCALWTANGPTFFRRKTKTLNRLCGCADWIESSLFAHVNRHLMLDIGSNTVNVLKFRTLFSFCSKLKWCWFSCLEFTNDLSELQTGKALIRLLL